MKTTEIMAVDTTYTKETENISLTALKHFPYGKTRETSANSKCYKQMLDSINRIENGSNGLYNEDPVCSLISNAVSFIGTLNSKLNHVSTEDLLTRFNMMRIVLRQMSSLTYGELLALFPIPIHYGGEYDPFDTMCEAIEECGIDIDCDMDETVNEDVISDFISGNYNNEGTWNFYYAYNATLQLLKKRDQDFENKYSKEQINSFDPLL